MRVVFLGNNFVGLKTLEWLRECNEEVVALVLPPTSKQKHAAEIVACSAVPQERCFEGSRLRDEAVLAAIQELEPEMAISSLFTEILDVTFLRIFPRGCINIHPALLPYNRGAYPNVWSIVDRTPAGVTIHQIDEGIDTGRILVQREVPLEPFDTGESVYRNLESTAIALFRESWGSIRDGIITPSPQDFAEGSYHRSRDVDAIDCINLDRSYDARTLIDILRARTFPPYNGAYFIHEGRKIYLRLELTPESD